MPRHRFVEWLKEAILQLPQDMKAVLRVVEDPDLPDEARIAAAGALLHVLSGANAIPGVRGVLGYVDDVLLLRIVLQRIAEANGETMDKHRDGAPELLEGLQEDLALAREFLGDGMKVLERAADGLPKLTYQGHGAKQCVFDTDSGNWLYDSVYEAEVDRFEFDEDEVAREVKRVADILPTLQARAAALGG